VKRSSSEGRRLGEHTDPGPHGVAVDGGVEAQHRNAAGVAGDDAAQHTHRRRLAGAVVAEEAEDLAGPYGEGDVVDDAAATEGTGEVLDLNDRRHRPPPP
jgi:hypothetical protein